MYKPEYTTRNDEQKERYQIRKSDLPQPQHKSTPHPHLANMNFNHDATYPDRYISRYHSATYSSITHGTTSSRFYESPFTNSITKLNGPQQRFSLSFLFIFKTYPAFSTQHLTTLSFHLYAFCGTIAQQHDSTTDWETPQGGYYGFLIFFCFND